MRWDHVQRRDCAWVWGGALGGPLGPSPPVKKRKKERDRERDTYIYNIDMVPPHVPTPFLMYVRKCVAQGGGKV